MSVEMKGSESKVVGGYIKVRDLGVGSFGKAILVRRADSEESYVMKAIDITRLNPKQREQSINEVKLLGSIKHPFIIGYKESFIVNGFLCIITDFADGGDLRSAIKSARKNKQHFEERQVVRWLVQCLLALKQLHERHILHRDVKSQNIFLCGPTKRVKLGDFGIAKSLDSTNALTNTLIGTPYYLSPEICDNKPYSWASDIWALGCVAYEMAALTVPFEAGSMKELVKKIMQCKPPMYPARYSTALRNIYTKCLRKDPKERPTASELLREPLIQQELAAMLKEEDQKSGARILGELPTVDRRAILNNSGQVVLRGRVEHTTGRSDGSQWVTPSKFRHQWLGGKRHQSPGSASTGAESQHLLLSGNRASLRQKMLAARERFNENLRAPVSQEGTGEIQGKSGRFSFLKRPDMWSRLRI